MMNHEEKKRIEPLIIPGAVPTPYKEMVPNMISKEKMLELTKELGFKQLFIIAGNLKNPRTLIKEVNDGTVDKTQDLTCTSVHFPPHIIKQILLAIASDLPDGPKDDDDEDEIEIRK